MSGAVLVRAPVGAVLQCFAVFWGILRVLGFGGSKAFLGLGILSWSVVLGFGSGEGGFESGGGGGVWKFWGFGGRVFW